MRVATWNINSLRKRQERLLTWLDQNKPDIICLQETKCTDDQFPGAALLAAGYHSAFLGQKAYNGVAILSVAKADHVICGMDEPGEAPQARVIEATFGNVQVMSIYAPNGQAVESPAFHYKLGWYALLRKTITERHGDAAHLLVCGDFNVAPANEDVHDPALWEGCIMCSGPERAAVRAVCDVGLADTFRIHQKAAGFFTWWDYRMLAFPKNRGLRIDYILAGATLAKRCRAAGIDREMRKGAEPSDHAPTWAEFES